MLRLILLSLFFYTITLQGTAYCGVEDVLGFLKKSKHTFGSCDLNENEKKSLESKLREIDKKYGIYIVVGSKRAFSSSPNISSLNHKSIKKETNYPTNRNVLIVLANVELGAMDGYVFDPQKARSISLIHGNSIHDNTANDYKVIEQLSGDLNGRMSRDNVKDIMRNVQIFPTTLINIYIPPKL